MTPASPHIARRFRADGEGVPIVCRNLAGLKLRGAAIGLHIAVCETVGS